MTTLTQTGLRDEIVDWRFKSFPPTDEPVTLDTIGEQHWNVLAGDLLFPVMLLKESALDHNIALMARYCREHGVSLAPHGKTPLSPQIVRRQLDAGAWGISAAGIHQVRVFRAFGVQRVLLANELIERAGLEWIAVELADDPSFDFLCLADSVKGVQLMAEALERVRPARPVRVLVELGVAGGRAGCRTSELALEVARAVKDSPYLELAGVEGYEGSIGAETLDERMAKIDRFLLYVREVTGDMSRSGLFEGLDEVILSAGGSLYFDRVVEQLSGQWNLPLPVRVVLRSGSYVTHDADSQERLSPLAARGGVKDRLRPALELWGMVLSRPEPDLAIAGFGKRDAPYDLRLPIPFTMRRDGTSTSIRGQVEVTALNDQHAYLKVDPECDLAVGDLIGCDISHPCTTFDKWRLIPLVNDAYDVTGAIQTFF